MTPIEEKGSFWVFDPIASEWSLLSPSDPISPYPAARSYHCLTNDGTDTIFLHAGCPEKGRLADLWAFQVSRRNWRQLASAPEPVRGGTSITFSAGNLFRMNGFDGKQEQGGSLDIYHPAANEWTSRSFTADGVSGPAPRSVSSLLALGINGRPSLVTLFGEHDPSSLGHEGAGKMLDDVWVYDIEAEKWVQAESSRGAEQTESDANKKPRPKPRGWFATDTVDHKGKAKIVVQGGLVESNKRLGDVWLLDFTAS
jgi:Galactose oxidase, central domain